MQGIVQFEDLLYKEVGFTCYLFFQGFTLAGFKSRSKGTLPPLHCSWDGTLKL